MKWFLRLFLLLTFTLLGEYGVHANSHGKANNYADAKIKQNTIANYHFHNIYDEKITSSVPGVAKTEYRKIRGTNEEDEDEENAIVIKKARLLKSNTAKFDFVNFAMSAPQQSLDDYHYTVAKSISFPFCFFSSKSWKLYSLFQVFKI